MPSWAAVYKFCSPALGYRAGIDGVLLAATVEAEPGAQVLDVGAGVGIVGLCVACRLPDVRVTMVERDDRLAALARRNIERNGFGDRSRVVEADVLRPLGDCPELAGAAESFDHVLANPPFFVEGRGTTAGDPVKARANAMPEGSLDRCDSLHGRDGAPRRPHRPHSSRRGPGRGARRARRPLRRRRHPAPACAPGRAGLARAGARRQGHGWLTGPPSLPRPAKRPRREHPTTAKALRRPHFLAPDFASGHKFSHLSSCVFEDINIGGLGYGNS